MDTAARTTGRAAGNGLNLAAAARNSPSVTRPALLAGPLLLHAPPD